MPPLAGDPRAAEIAAIDAKVFTACNTSDPDTFARYFDPDVVFFDDTAGATFGRKTVVVDIRKYICGKARRELLPETRVRGGGARFAIGRVACRAMAQPWPPRDDRGGAAGDGAAGSAQNESGRAGHPGAPVPIRTRCASDQRQRGVLLLRSIERPTSAPATPPISRPVVPFDFLQR